MMPRKRMWVAFGVGAFISLSVLSLMALIILQGGTRRLFERHFSVRVRLADATGLVPGAPVKMLGLRIGTVHAIQLTGDNNVDVTMRIDEAYHERIRVEPSLYPRGLQQPPVGLKPDEEAPGSVVAVHNPGIVGIGDLTLEVTPAALPLRRVEEGDYLAVRPVVDATRAAITSVTDFFKKLQSEGTVADILSDGGKLYRGLQSSIEQLDTLLKNANRGDNTVQRLFDDKGDLYQRAQASLADLSRFSEDLRKQQLPDKLDGLIARVNDLTARLAELTDSLKVTTDKLGKASSDVPPMVADARHTFQAASDAAEALKRHWLIYSYVTPDRPPERLIIQNRRSRYE